MVARQARSGYVHMCGIYVSPFRFYKQYHLINEVLQSVSTQL